MNRLGSFDVIVVGGRVAGASSAMLLARAGARVLLLERADHGADSLSTHGLMRAGVLQLARWGLLDRVVDAGTPAVRSTTFRVAGEPPLELAIADRHGVDALYAPRRHVLDRLLVDAAAEAGVEVRHGTTVTRLLRDGRGRVTGVGTVDRSGAESSAEATYVVGADGIRSFVAEAAGARVIEQKPHASAVRYTYVAGLDAPGYEWGYGNGAAAGLIPTNDGEHCVFVATSPQRMRTLRLGRSADQVLDLLVGLAAPDLRQTLRDAQRVSRHHGWVGASGFRRKPWGRGWALVGDAGYYQDPIGSHGITAGLRDAELLSRALLDALGGGHGALAGYHRLRDRLSQELFDVTDAVASYRWDDAGVSQLLRRLSAAMADETELLASLPDRDPRTLAEPAPA